MRIAMKAARTSTILTALGLALTLTACQASPTATSTHETSTLRLAETNEYETLNPLEYTFSITSKFYDSLVAVGANGLEPQLATQMPTANDDLTVWTVKLRDGVTFSDGSDFDADDVVAAYRAVLDPETASPLRGDYQLITGIEATDPSTVTFTLSAPYAAFPSLLTLGIPSSEKVGGSILDSSLAREPVGTGPYVLAEWQQGTSLTLRAREDYWRGKPTVENIYIGFVSDENARAQRLLGGDFDGAQLSPLAAAQLDGKQGLEMFVNPSGDYRGITLPESSPLFTDPNVRIALNLGTDRQAMVDGILASHGTAIATPITPSFGPVYNPDAVFTYDPERAAALLDAAGWTVGSDGTRSKDGTPFSFEVMYFAEDTVRRDLAQAFASDMAKLGIQVQLTAVDRTQAKQRIADTAFVLGGGDVPYDPDTQIYGTLHSSFASYDPTDPYSNPSQYRNPDVDALLDKARGEADDDARAADYRELQMLLISDPAGIDLFAVDHAYVARGLDQYTNVEHVVEPHEHGVAWGPWWNVADWR